MNGARPACLSRRRSARQGGFTLTETLVALFILALLSSAGSGLLLGASTSGKQIREQETSARQIDIAQAFIRGDIGAMSTRAVRPEWGTGRPGNLFGEQPSGRAPFLQFVRSGWIISDPEARRSSLQYVSYFLDQDRLVRRAQARPDVTDSTAQVERVLFENVAGVQLRFRGGIEWSEEWVGDAGQDLTILPELIELDIRFDDGTALTIAALTGGRA
ncbi:MAG: type II secretion system minor pseudopilin GspJ [Pseudomonadota bacterium]